MTQQQPISIKQAFTLLELLLVLAILVAIAGIAAPTFDSLVTSRRLLQATTQLRNELMEARVTAMRTGQAQVLQATLQGADYSIVPWQGGTDSQDASAGAMVTSASGQIVATDAASGGGVAISEPSLGSDVKKLAEGVTFSAIEMLSDSRSALAVQQVQGAGNVGASGGLSSPLLIYPDGSCTTAQVILIDTKGRRMAIQIRGVVGQISTMKLTSDTPPAASQP